MSAAAASVVIVEARLKTCIALDVNSSVIAGTGVLSVGCFGATAAATEADVVGGDAPLCCGENADANEAGVVGVGAELAGGESAEADVVGSLAVGCCGATAVAEADGATAVAEAPPCCGETAHATEAGVPGICLKAGYADSTAQLKP